MHAGNYDTYLQVRSELEDAQMKKHKWEQDQISHMKVSSCFEPLSFCFAAGLDTSQFSHPCECTAG